MARKKNSIFSGKDRNGFDKRTLNIINKTLASTGDIRSLNRSQRRMYERYLKAQEKELKKMGYKSDKFTSEPTSLFSEHMRQRQFMNEIEDYTRERDEVKYFGYDDVEPLIKDEDKWNILRRLATLDTRLNVDRAYASQTLRDIENMIESNNDTPQFETWQDLADFLYEDLATRGVNSQEWNSVLKPLTSDDALFAANRGFHGIVKAREAYQRRTRKSLSNYEPVWASPFNFTDVEV